MCESLQKDSCGTSGYENLDSPFDWFVLSHSFFVCLFQMIVQKELANNSYEHDD